LANANKVSADNDVDHGLVDWLNSLEGGYSNPKQEIRRENPDDPNSMVGLFAKELIEEGEILNQVPWHGIITSEGWKEDDDNGTLDCGIVRSTAHEMKLGEKSKYGPYVSYLLEEQREGQLPSAWSEAGIDLLMDILGGEDEKKLTLPPDYAFTWLEDEWYGSCNGDRTDYFTAQVAMLVVSRGDGDIMVPILYNHRNGHWHNAEVHINDGENHQVRAARTIEAGEQIYISHNMCDECTGRRKGYGTAGK
jgi:hypothetical protein